MPKNIVLLSDGTGNSAGSLFKTNVWRLYQILDLSDPERQVAFYDDGVGTSSFKLFAMLGSIFGFGLKRNVIAIYSFCCRNYQPGDRIYCFGFSRGSFTIRMVVGLIASQGLVDYNDNEADLARFAADAYRRYRRRFNSGILKYLGDVGIDLRGMRDAAIRWWRARRGQPVEAPPAVDVESIQFVGIWDTVDAYGGPIQEMTRAIDYWLWPLSMPDQFMSAKVLKACHAMSLEDERDAFSPVIWDQRYVRGTGEVPGRAKTDWLFDINYDPRSEAAKQAEPAPHQRTQLPAIDQQRISQVWFVGVHADVGGGYPQNGLAYVTLDWMLDRAENYGLRYFPGQRAQQIDPQVNPDDKLNDSRKGLAAYYRYKPRNIRDLYGAPPYKPSLRDDVARVWRMLRRLPDPQTRILEDLHPSVSHTVLSPPEATMHESIFKRIRSGTDRYVPVVMPASYYYTGKDGSVTHGLHPVDPGHRRSHVQDDVWNWIWLRRVVYFLTVFATWFVVMTPVWVIYAPGFGKAEVGGFVNPIVNAAASFLPGFLDPWWVAFRNGPGFVLAGSVVAFVFLVWGARLKETVHDVARVAWHSPAGYTSLTGWRAAIYRLRRLRIYRVFFFILTNWILPTAIMFWLFWWLAFGTANTLGLVCKGTGGLLVGSADAVKASANPIVMETSSACNATNLRVIEGKTYRITLTVKTPWLDDGIATDPNGFGWHGASWLEIFVPYRRLIWSNWFATILRVGGPGFEEHRLQLEQKDGAWTATFEPRSSGEVFLYVNDAVIGLPWIYDRFYRNNHGTAEVKLEKVETGSP
jgi:Uncharacterized alpha/beta hydrolase domain (DUF2235)